MNAVANPNDFEALYSQTGLNNGFQLNLYNVLKGHIDDLRKILENDITLGVHRLKDIDWRLSMITACRQKQKMMQPKYTMKLSLEQTVKTTQDKQSADNNGELTGGCEQKVEDLYLDLDYVTMKRL